jgi:hypothetical protein
MSVGFVTFANLTWQAATQCTGFMPLRLFLLAVAMSLCLAGTLGGLLMIEVSKR